MAKILFDIKTDHIPAIWQRSHMVMEISGHLFSFAVISPEKKLLQLRFYSLDATSQHDLAAELGHIIDTDNAILKSAERKTFLYNFPESQLVPEQYFQSANGAALITLLNGDLNKGIVFSERIQGQPIYNVYQVPAEIHGLLQRSFANGKYWHYYSVWMLAAQKEPALPATGLSVLVYPNRILVCAFKDRQLLLLQSYAYEAAEDVGYFLLNICQQLEFAPENIPLRLSGMIDESSVLFTEMAKYFGTIVLDEMPAMANTPALEEYPPHFFSPLLKLAACAS